MEVEFISALLVLIAVMGSIAFVAAAEVSLASTTRGRVRHMIDAGVDRAKVLDTLLNDPARFLSTLMLLKSAAYITGGAAALWLMIRQQWPWAEGILLMAAVGFALVTVQIAACAFTLRHPERAALALGSTVQTSRGSCCPSHAAALDGQTGAQQAKDVTAQSIFLSEDGLRYLINVGEGEGVIEEEEKQMIASIFEMGDHRA
ncbi:MAG: CNNM domain-containing protein [Caldilineaceae bacterium]